MGKGRHYGKAVKSFSDLEQITLLSEPQFLTKWG